MKTIEIYPSTIYIDNIKNDKYINSTIQLIQTMHESQQLTNDCSVRNGWQSSKDLYDNSHFAILADYVLNKIRVELLQNKLTPVMTEMWANVHDQHGFNHVHVHSGSWYSGAVYLQCSEKTGNITFTDPRPGAEMSAAHQLTATTQTVTPKPGDMILFPSFLPHLVEPNCDGIKRISISFNIDLRHA